MQTVFTYNANLLIQSHVQRWWFLNCRDINIYKARQFCIMFHFVRAFWREVVVHLYIQSWQLGITWELTFVQTDMISHARKNATQRRHPKLSANITNFYITVICQLWNIYNNWKRLLISTQPHCTRYKPNLIIHCSLILRQILNDVSIYLACALS